MKYGSPQADKYIYVEYKGYKDRNDTHIVFINTDDVDSTEILILHEMIKNREK